MQTFYFIVATILILGLYSYFGLGSVIKNGGYKWIYSILYVLIMLFVFYMTYSVYSSIIKRNLFSGTEVNFAIGVVITALVTLVFFGSLMFLQDFGRLMVGLVKRITDNPIVFEDGIEKYIPSRRKFLTMAAAGITAIPFFSLIYGFTKGKYNYKVSNVSLAFKDLPKAFDGFKIVQISDIHAGSLDDASEVLRGVEMVNAQDPDIITFTGDLVNSSKDEVNPYIDIFAKLQAKVGKYAILGNHDYYGLHGIEESDEQEAYWTDFFTKFKAMGFDLLRNETRILEKDGDKIELAGVENWGAGRWFPKKGDLDKTFAESQEDDFTILMSHDPTHWSEKVIDHSKKVALTLSGHTHGMQFGINLPGFKWSPAQMRYKHWMGLYEEKGEYLYVNRGFGFLAFPGRIGMWPEITVIELRSV